MLVAQNGEVLIDKSFGIADQARYMPTTTVPQFPLGGISGVFTSLCSQLPELPVPARPSPPDTVAGRGAGRGRGDGLHEHTVSSLPRAACIDAHRHAQNDGERRR